MQHLHGIGTRPAAARKRLGLWVVKAVRAGAYLPYLYTGIAPDLLAAMLAVLGSKLVTKLARGA